MDEYEKLNQSNWECKSHSSPHFLKRRFKSIVGMVGDPGTGSPKQEDQPLAQRNAYAQQPPMWRADKAREPVPTARDAERPVSPARRKVAGRSQRNTDAFKHGRCMLTEICFSYCSQFPLRRQRSGSRAMRGPRLLPKKPTAVTGRAEPARASPNCARPLMA
jgi:hypothetical protein